jgi:hypothetical protein
MLYCGLLDLLIHCNSFERPNKEHFLIIFDPVLKII